MSLPVGPDTVIIGVLALVPDPLGRQVRQLREGYSDDLVAVPTHVTLVPPTPVAEADLPAIVDHLDRAAAAHRPFPVRVRGTGTFQPVTDVVYLRVEQGREEFDALQAGLRAGPLVSDLRFPYHPHVTLAHDVPQGALDHAFSTMASVEEEFEVDGFTLYVDRADGDWERVRDFTLGAS